MGLIEDKLRRDLALRGLRPNTIEKYVCCCRRFVAHFRRSPLHMSASDVRIYLEHLREVEHKKPRSINVYAAALAFLYRETLARKEEVGRIPRMRTVPSIPTVLSGGEIERLIAALATPLQRAVVVTAYGAGLRVSEACGLRLDSIDSERMQIHVRDGKGGCHRDVPLSPRVLDELRAYSGGGLDVAADRWVSAGRKFLFPVHVMGALFRGKMLDALKKAHARGELDFGDQDPNALFANLYKTRWVVYAKRPFGDAEHVVRYLGRYTHRVGISNGRIESVSREQVRFRTKQGKHATLTPEEFLRRFVMHVPAGFVKIRHFGLLAPGNVHGRLEIARRRLVEAGAPPAPSTTRSHTPRSAIELLLALIGVDVRACPKCLARACVRGPLPLPLAPTEPRDTS